MNAAFAFATAGSAATSAGKHQRGEPVRQVLLDLLYVIPLRLLLIRKIQGEWRGNSEPVAVERELVCTYTCVT